MRRRLDRHDGFEREPARRPAAARDVAGLHLEGAGDTASGEEPRLRIGSSRAKNPDSCTVRPWLLAALSRSAGLDTSSAIVCARSAAWAARRFVRELIEDLLPHFCERARVCRASCPQLDDVVSELRLDQIARLSRHHREDDLIEFGHHLALAEVIEIAAVLGAAFVLRIFLRKRGEVGARSVACLSTSSAFAFTAASNTLNE